MILKRCSPWTTPYSAVYPRLFMQLLPASAQQARSVLHDTNLTWDDLRRRDAVVNFRQFLALVHNAIDTSETPSLALQAGAVTTIATHGQVGLAMMAAPDLEKALAAMVRFIVIRGPFIEANLTKEGDWTSIDIDIPSGTRDDYPHVLEFVLLCIQSAIHAVSPGALTSGRLELAYPAPTYAAEYKRFFRMPVAFGQARNRIVLATASLAPPIESASAAAFGAVVRECEQLLRSYGQSAIESRIRAALARHPGEILTLDQVAALLAISPRTLQRRCADENVAFKRIQDDWHRELVSIHLEEGVLTLEQIAARIGFADVTGLRRAALRWRGSPAN